MNRRALLFSFIKNSNNNNKQYKAQHAYQEKERERAAHHAIIQYLICIFFFGRYEYIYFSKID